MPCTQRPALPQAEAPHLHGIRRHLVAADGLGGARHRLPNKQLHNVAPLGAALQTREQARGAGRGAGGHVRHTTFRHARPRSISDDEVHPIPMQQQPAGRSTPTHTKKKHTCCSVRRRSPSVKMPASRCCSSATSTQPQLRPGGGGGAGGTREPHKAGGGAFPGMHCAVLMEAAAAGLTGLQASAAGPP